MKNFIAAVALVFGSIAAVLQIADWLLSKDQKGALSDWLIRSWDWLDDQSKGTFIPALWSRRVQFFLAALWALPVATMELVAAIYNVLPRFGVKVPKSENTDVEYGIISFVFFVLLVVAFIFLHRRIVKQSASLQGVKAYFRFTFRKALLYSPSLLGLFLLNPIALLPVFGPKGLFIGFALTLFLLPFFLEAAMLWSVLWLAILWVVLTWILVRLMRVVAFILRRALEQEKGVLAGAAALLLVIAALLKFK